jgi:hypothetical protein
MKSESCTSWYALSPNNLLQRSVNDKVLGRGRVRAVREQVCAARVLERTRAVAEQGR